MYNHAEWLVCFEGASFMQIEVGNLNTEEVDRIVLGVEVEPPVVLFPQDFAMFAPTYHLSEPTLFLSPLPHI